MNQDGQFDTNTTALIDSTTNYLTPQMFDDFLWGLVRLEAFTGDYGRPPMSADKFVALYRTLYSCGLRIGEGLKLKKTNFDLDHRILKIYDAKTGKGKIQRTTILPRDILFLKQFLLKFQDDDLLFPINRQVAWRYAKDAGKLAGLEIFETQSEREVEGVWTHLFRKSCAKNMREKGASIELCALKLRHKLQAGNAGGGRVTYTYTMPDLNALLRWEALHFA